MIEPLNKGQGINSKTKHDAQPTTWYYIVIMLFKQNEGTLDRLLRATLGTVLLLAGLLWTSGWLMWLSLIIAVLMFFTAILGHCVPYTWLKFNTLKLGLGIPKWAVWLWLAVLVVGFLYVYFR